MKHEALAKSEHTHRFPRFYPQINNCTCLGARLMTTLADLGFSKDSIVEKVVSTYNVDGQPKAAPMGATKDTPKD
jgi:hypothetical protein